MLILKYISESKKYRKAKKQSSNRPKNCTIQKCPIILCLEEGAASYVKQNLSHHFLRQHVTSRFLKVESLSAKLARQSISQIFC